jgi:hypothetical protein
MKKWITVAAIERGEYYEIPGDRGLKHTGYNVTCNQMGDKPEVFATAVHKNPAGCTFKLGWGYRLPYEPVPDHLKNERVSVTYVSLMTKDGNNN